MKHADLTPWRAWRAVVPAAMIAVALGAGGPARADLAEVIAQSVENSLNGLDGTEASGSGSGSVLGVNVTLNLLGAAFCVPPSPTAPPVATPVPPLNAYGCVNAAQVTASLQADQSSGLLTVTLGNLFIDVETRRDRTIYCAESGSGTVTRPGYLLGDAVVTAPITVVVVDGCREVVLGSVEAAIGDIEPHFTDTCINTVATLGSVMLSLFESSFTPYFQQLLQVAVDDANPAICAATQAAAAPVAAAERPRLRPGRPNPFNPTTALAYDLPQPAVVRLAVYDTSGRLVKLLVDGFRSAGTHQASWDGRDERGVRAAAGVYVCRLEAAAQYATQRVTLLP